MRSDSELLRDYLEHLRSQRQLAAHTLDNYRRDLIELRQLAPAATALAALSQFDIRRLAAQLHGRGLSAASIARKLSAWRGFFEWLGEHQALAANPVAGVRPPKRARPLPKALSADDAVRLVAQPAPSAAADDPARLCDAAMFELLYSSGLRVSELVGLDWRYLQQPDHVSAGWIDFDAAEVLVTGKGSKLRRVPVGAPALAALRRWLQVRPQLDRSGASPALFLGGRGNRISARLVQLRLKAHARAIGLASDVHPHVLRHSFASHVLQSSGDLRAVQEMLGHAQIASTQVYTSLDFQRLAQVYDAAHPRAKRSPQGK